MLSQALLDGAVAAQGLPAPENAIEIARKVLDAAAGTETDFGQLQGKDVNRPLKLAFRLARRTLDAWSAAAGCLWSLQFFFYGLGHVQMGRFQFASWVLHMSMLIFFSYVVGVAMKEWKSVRRGTSSILVAALVILVVSFIVTSYGSYYGEQMMTAAK